MRRTQMLLVLVTGLILIGTSTSLAVSPTEDLEQQSVLVQLDAAYHSADGAEVLRQAGFIVMRYLPQIDVWLVTGPKALSDAETLSTLRQHPAVSWAEENGSVSIQEVTPNDNFYQAQQENLRVIGLPLAWSITTGDAVPIAVIDTGADLDHPDLHNKLWLNIGEIPDNGLDDDLNGYVDDTIGWDFVNDDNEPHDDQSHGSHVAGIAAAETNNAVGIAGVSWGAQVMALKALDNQGNGTWANVAEAILYAADNGAQILNMSFGDDESSSTLELAIEYANEKQCLLVAAAGNGGGSVLYPAVNPAVLAVAATNNQDLPWTFSNRGTEIDLAAPGVDILSVNALGSYSKLSGTSMSAAHVSGVASLMWTVTPTLTSWEMRQLLTATAVDVWSPGFDLLTGWGRVSASQAVARAGSGFAYLPVVRLD